MKNFTMMLCGILTLMSGCATWQPEPPLAGMGEASWRLQGKVSIRTREESRILKIDWRQQGDLGQIDLSGLFGIGVARIETQSDELTVTTGEGTYRYTDDLALQVNGLGEISLPWNAFAYWIRGLTEPRPDNKAGSKPIAAKGHSSGPWDIQVLHRDTTGPRLIQFTHQLASVKLKITTWSALPPDRES